MKKKKIIYLVLGVLLLAGAVFGGIKVFQGTYAPREVATESMEAVTPAPTAEPTPEPTAPPEPVEITPTPEPTAEPTPEPTPYISPVDFDWLQSKNSDIYAWIEIPDTNIDDPVVQDPDDDAFYLNHNTDRAYSANGSVFSEHQYNGTDMSDPVTLLYGHHMASGAIFGYLQKYYSDGDFFSSHPTFTIYTPDATLTYGVFAAVPWSSDHLLYWNDFSDDEVFESFFESVFYVRDLSAHFNEDYAPHAGDKVVILSTCLIGNNTNRFLVMATLLD